MLDNAGEHHVSQTGSAQACEVSGGIPVTGSLGPTGDSMALASCPKSIPTKRLARVSTSELGGGSPSIWENRPPNWSWASCTSDRAVGTTVGSGVAVAVGTVPCAAAGVCRLERLARAISKVTTSSRTVAPGLTLSNLMALELLDGEGCVNRDFPYGQSPSSKGNPNDIVASYSGSQFLQGQSISGLSNKGCDSCREPCFLSIFVVFGPPPMG